MLAPQFFSKLIRGAPAPNNLLQHFNDTHVFNGSGIHLAYLSRIEDRAYQDNAWFVSTNETDFHQLTRLDRVGGQSNYLAKYSVTLFAPGIDEVKLDYILSEEPYMGLAMISSSVDGVLIAGPLNLVNFRDKTELLAKGAFYLVT